MNERYETSFWMVAGLAVLLGAAPAWAQQGGAASQAVQAARQAFRGDDLQGKDGPFAKVGMDLARLYYRAQLGGVATQGAGVEAGQTTLPVRDDRIRIDAVATESATALLAELEALGLEGGATAGPVVSGWLPIGAIAEAAQLGKLRFARPSLAKIQGKTNNGARSMRQEAPIVSQGVQSLGAAEARNQFGVTGEGVTVGVLSDSYDCIGDADDDEEAGEVPPNVLVKEESECVSGTDEGRAMVQIIFDVAPEADQRFNTAFGGIATFANGICRLGGLSDTGVCEGVKDVPEQSASIIVDDVIYFAEPMFAEGVVAQAVNEVTAQGVAYFSSAGNSDGQSYESDEGFRDSRQEGLLEDGPLHDFDPSLGSDAYQQVSLQQGLTGTLSLQWAQPYASTSADSPGASSDLDLVLLDKNGNEVDSSNFANIGNDPTEVLQYENDGSVDADGNGVADTTFQIAIELADGPPPEELLKIVYTSFNRLEYETLHSTVYGHANTSGAEAVGAASWFNTPGFNEERQAAGFGALEAAIATNFSALGGTPIFFDQNGNRLGTPEVRAKPEVSGPDGGDNTFFGEQLPADPFAQLGDDTSVPNFFGTSAAAPHVAGVAALMRALNPDLARDRLFQILEETANDMTPEAMPIERTVDEQICAENFDFKTGCGFVDAVAALDAVPVTLRVQSQVVVVDGESQVELSVTTETPQEAERFIIARCFGTRDECGTGGAGYERVQTIEATGERTFTFTADVPTQSGTYTFVVRQQNRDGGSTLVRTTEVTLDLAGGAAFELTEAFPSPFQSRTELRLVVGQNNEPIDVTATLYDALGRRVRTIFDESVQGQTVIPLPAGDLSSGVYFIRVRSENFLETRSVVLVR